MIERYIVYFRYFMGRACRESKDRHFGQLRVYILMSLIGGHLALGVLGLVLVALGVGRYDVSVLVFVISVLVPCLLVYRRYLSSDDLLRRYYEEFGRLSIRRRRTADAVSATLSVVAVALPFVVFEFLR